MLDISSGFPLNKLVAVVDNNTTCQVGRIQNHSVDKPLGMSVRGFGDWVECEDPPP